MASVSASARAARCRRPRSSVSWSSRISPYRGCARRTRADDPAASRKNVERHNIEGSPGCTPIASLYDSERDWVVDTKKRYDCFIATDLDFVLRKHKVNTLFVTGVNTNSCVLCTAATANTLDYLPIVVEDCVGSMDGADRHEAALLCIRTALGFAMPQDAVFEALAANGFDDRAEYDEFKKWKQSQEAAAKP